MISVAIFINGKQIERVDAVRVKGDSQPDTVNIYEITGPCKTDAHDRIIAHRYGDGAVRLAVEMLQRLKDDPAG